MHIIHNFLEKSIHGFKIDSKLYIFLIEGICTQFDMDMWITLSTS